MKIKTSELTGAALDWAGAKCEGWIEHPNNPVNRPESYTYRPSTSWKDGGPIIEQAKITIRFWRNETFCTAYRNEDGAEWVHGETPLIAAMRCYVASKLGDEVEIPEELK